MIEDERHATGKPGRLESKGGKERARDINEKVYGPDHAEVDTALSNLTALSQKEVGILLKQVWENLEAIREMFQIHDTTAGGLKCQLIFERRFI